MSGSDSIVNAVSRSFSAQSGMGIYRALKKLSNSTLLNVLAPGDPPSEPEVQLAYRLIRAPFRKQWMGWNSSAQSTFYRTTPMNTADLCMVVVGARDDGDGWENMTGSAYIFSCGSTIGILDYLLGRREDPTGLDLNADASVDISDLILTGL